MQNRKKTKQKVGKTKVFPWRATPNKWTDTMFDIKLLRNPSRMTNTELAMTLEEHQLWRKGLGKYDWGDSVEAMRKAEKDTPFSPEILSNLLMETIARLRIIGDLVEGRFKKTLRA